MPAGGPALQHDKAALLKEATEQYKFDSLKARAKDDPAAPIDKLLAVEGLKAHAVKMNKKLLHGSDHDWVGAIWTNMAYDPMGLGPGMNYIFRLPTSHPDSELVVVPADKSYPARYLSYNPYLDLSRGQHGAPLLIRKSAVVGTKSDAIAIGGCIECSIGHCSTLQAGDLYQ
jgi:hypothetical protein